MKTIRSINKAQELKKTGSISITGHQGFIKPLRSIIRDQDSIKKPVPDQLPKTKAQLKPTKSITKDQDSIKTHSRLITRDRGSTEPHF
jgi:hypothetical protein